MLRGSVSGSPFTVGRLFWGAGDVTAAVRLAERQKPTMTLKYSPNLGVRTIGYHETPRWGGVPASLALCFKICCMAFLPLSRWPSMAIDTRGLTKNRTRFVS